MDIIHSEWWKTKNLKKLYIFYAPGTNCQQGKHYPSPWFLKCAEQEEKVRQRIEHANAVCLTIDGWTSDNNDSYLAVTAHYVVSSLEDTKLQSNLLGCVEYNERHTSENLRVFKKHNVGIKYRKQNYRNRQR